MTDQKATRRVKKRAHPKNLPPFTRFKDRQETTTEEFEREQMGIAPKE